MHVLIVYSHPKPTSLTASLAKTLASAIESSEGSHTAEIADLASEGFDPRFTERDITVQHGKSDQLPEIVAEQQRIDRADALVLVYPVYWWSFPALLKGWIDRVFMNGWAYDDRTEPGKVRKLLSRLPVHTIALAGADERTYARHGYFGAMKLQINQGIFDYCGATVRTSELVFEFDPEGALQTAKDLASRICGKQ
ncbi:MAG: NAD(P)H-dependent oxidoreductase [Verrucomicrobiota bacterium JB022]|nr:NAD(P)H-dependent oxidoreductase [Verrucomicrobiota bacterium JB022]